MHVTKGEDLRFQSQLYMRTKDPAPTGEESPEAPRNTHGDWTLLRQHKGVPEVPFITQEESPFSGRNSRKIWRVSPQREMRTFTTVVSREESHLPF